MGGTGRRLEGGKWKLLGYFTLHTPILLWCLLHDLGSIWRSWHLGSGNISSSFCPFSLRIVMISCYWYSLSCLTFPFASSAPLSPMDSSPCIKFSLFEGPLMMSAFSADLERFNMATSVPNTVPYMCGGLKAPLWNE